MSDLEDIYGCNIDFLYFPQAENPWVGVQVTDKLNVPKYLDRSQLGFYTRMNTYATFGNSWSI